MLRSPPLAPLHSPLSGGGYRAAGFHLGVLDMLYRLDLLKDVSALSTVSGGTFTGVRYALSLKAGEPFPVFLEKLKADLLSIDVPQLALAKLTSSAPAFGLFIFSDTEPQQPDLYVPAEAPAVGLDAPLASEPGPVAPARLFPWGRGRRPAIYRHGLGSVVGYFESISAGHAALHRGGAALGPKENLQRPLPGPGSSRQRVGLSEKPEGESIHRHDGAAHFIPVRAGQQRFHAARPAIGLYLRDGQRFKGKLLPILIYNLLKATVLSPPLAWLNPSEAMREVATAAESIPTTLWFTNSEQLPHLLACGQITICRKLLLHILSLCGYNPDAISPQLRPLFDKARLLFEQLKETPYSLISAPPPDRGVAKNFSEAKSDFA